MAALPVTSINRSLANAREVDSLRRRMESELNRLEGLVGETRQVVLNNFTNGFTQCWEQVAFLTGRLDEFANGLQLNIETGEKRIEGNVTWIKKQQELERNEREKSIKDLATDVEALRDQMTLIKEQQELEQDKREKSIKDLATAIEELNRRGGTFAEIVNETTRGIRASLHEASQGLASNDRLIAERQEKEFASLQEQMNRLRSQQVTSVADHVALRNEGVALATRAAHDMQQLTTAVKYALKKKWMGKTLSGRRQAGQSALRRENDRLKKQLQTMALSIEKLSQEVVALSQKVNTLELKNLDHDPKQTIVRQIQEKVPALKDFSPHQWTFMTWNVTDRRGEIVLMHVDEKLLLKSCVEQMNESYQASLLSFLIGQKTKGLRTENSAGASTESPALALRIRRGDKQVCLEVLKSMLGGRPVILA